MDLLTKGLSKKLVYNLSKKIGLRPLKYEKVL
jgi:hypothetical protein